MAARKQHLEYKIKPALAQGTWVLSDRFNDATYAYQGAGRGIASQRIEALEYWAQEDFQPHYTVIFDLPVAQGLARVVQRGKRDRFEDEDVAFFEKIRQCYRQRATLAPQRYHVIDASLPLEDVQQQLIQIMDTWLARHV